MSGKQYILFLITGTFVALGIIGAFNAFVDPYWLYEGPRIEGFNYFKKEYAKNTRKWKLFQLVADPPAILFLGSSRMEDLAPEDAALAYLDGPAFNLAVSGGTLSEAKELLRFALRKSDLTNVFFGTDFFVFSDFQQGFRPGFDPKLVRGEKWLAWEKFKVNIAERTINRSFRNIGDNQEDPEGRRELNHYNRFGSRINHAQKMLLKEGGEKWLKKKFEASLEQYDGIYKKISTIPQTNKNIYKAMREDCRRAQVDLIAIAMPLYVDHWRMLLVSQAYPHYLEYLQYLASNGGFYFFHGNGRLLSDRKNFWDSHHARKPLSDQLFAYIMADQDDRPMAEDYFGEYIDQDNIGELLRYIEEQRMNYLRNSE